ncbi:Importin alpha re-exporter [Nakaseomyces bracarensis]|uniref:Importin alpha re-exporter n=1 Tax=Nakaseomyces bracarensis TaxID=273131 RepID=A0ABR4NUJ6_9SACH
MSDLETVAQYLADSVVAATSKSAEKNLKQLETQDGFGLTLLHIVASSNLPIATRLAGALFFKNFIRRKWIDENGNHLLSANNVELIKSEIVPLMISLPGNLQVQIGEAISVIADSDFPERWPTLLDDLVSKLSPTDMVTNKGVLSVAHSIFKRWRPLFRTDELFLEIKMVLDKFTVPFLNLMKSVDEQIDSKKNDQASLELLFDVLLLQIKLYYDFNCQDIPEFFEDHIQEGMGMWHKYLSYENPLLEDPDDSEHAGVLIRVKTSIQELVQLYTTRYEEFFGPMINEFIQITWNLLVNVSNQPKYDILVSKSLSFLTAVARIPKYFEAFNSETAMHSITEQIILPNFTLREEDVELFEDDPMEYIRRDLEGSDTDTRRRSCSDFLSELKEKNEVLVTNIILEHVKKFYEQYTANPQEYWKYKDLYINLFTSLAIKGTITHTGVSSTNSLIDIIDFFTKQILPDLTSTAVPHPILRIDAIKFIYIFRNQLNKQQLIELLPLLANFLNSDEYLVYTYAAITIERILAIRESPSSPVFIFNKGDLSGSAQILITNLLGLIKKQGDTPEKLAHNEFLIRAVFKVLQTAEDTLQGMTPELMTQFIGIVDIISKNPSNPKFSHYVFESIGVLLHYASSPILDQIVELMMPSFFHILSEDIQEFIPYVFQLIAYAVENLQTIPASIQQLSQPILAPSVWELKGNVPAVTRLLKAFIKKNYSIFSDLVPVLGIFQRLIASKAYEVHGFDLLECIFFSIDLEVLRPFIKQIAILLLQRLQSSKTERYVKKLTVFLGLVAYKLGPDFVVFFIDEVQEGVFNQIWSNFIIPTVPTLGNLLDRKIALLGMNSIISSPSTFQSKYPDLMIPTASAVVSTIVSDSVATVKNDFVDLDNIEEISTFGSHFSRLGSIAEKNFDPAPEVDINDGIKLFVLQGLKKFNEMSNNLLLTSVVSQLPESSQQIFNQLWVTQ